MGAKPQREFTDKMSDIATERFEKRHPPHAKRGGEPYETKVYPSPTTDHVRVQCGCGWTERFTFLELGFEPTDQRVRTAPG